MGYVLLSCLLCLLGHLGISMDGLDMIITAPISFWDEVFAAHRIRQNILIVG